MHAGRGIRAGWFLCLLMHVAPANACATTIVFQLLSFGENRWAYQYDVSGFFFQANEGFSVVFERELYKDLSLPPESVRPDWSQVVLQPDLNLPEDGSYDALALSMGANLTRRFTVDFVFTGLGQPGSQEFSVYQSNPESGFIETFEFGRTEPLPAAAPEPSARSLTTLALGAVALAGRRWKRRSRFRH